jgi:hypothetical protein
MRPGREQPIVPGARAAGLGRPQAVHCRGQPSPWVGSDHSLPPSLQQRLREGWAARLRHVHGQRCASEQGCHIQVVGSSRSALALPPTPLGRTAQFCSTISAKLQPPPCQAAASSVASCGLVSQTRFVLPNSPPQPALVEVVRSAAHGCAAAGASRLRLVGHARCRQCVATPPQSTLAVAHAVRPVFRAGGAWRSRRDGHALCHSTTQPPSPAGSGGACAPCGPCVCRLRRVAITAGRARTVPPARRDLSPPAGAGGACAQCGQCVCSQQSIAIVEGPARTVPPARHDRPP